MINFLDFGCRTEQSICAFKRSSSVIMIADTEAAPKKQRILIVEDEPFIVLALEAMLLEFGFDVAGSATQVSAALELIGREQIDGAILDVNLGEERIDPVADILATRRCPFFFTTGYGISGIPARHAGRAVLQKPFGLEQLSTLLRAEFGSPIYDRRGSPADGTLSHGHRQLPARHTTGIPISGL
jgi:DNA-binding response OmpR family regulator